MKGIEILGFIWELEFRKLKFGRNWNFGNYLRDWNFKNRIVKMGTLEIKFWKKLELKTIWEVETMKIKLYKLESLEIVWIEGGILLKINV